MSAVRRPLTSTLVRWVCPRDGFFKIIPIGVPPPLGGAAGWAFGTSAGGFLLAFALFLGPLILFQRGCGASHLVFLRSGERRGGEGG